MKACERPQTVYGALAHIQPFVMDLAPGQLVHRSKIVRRQRFIGTRYFLEHSNGLAESRHHAFTWASCSSNGPEVAHPLGTNSLHVDLHISNDDQA